MTEYYSNMEDYDPSRWLPVPMQWPVPGFEKDLPDIPAWADIAAKAVWSDSRLSPRQGELDELAGILAYAAEKFPKVYPGFEVFLHLPGPRDNPLPVYIGDFEADADPEADLRLWTAADDPDAVEPPIVEEFDSPHLGKGLRVLRYSRAQNDSGEILVGLRYGWHLEQLDLNAFLWTASPTPARLLTCIDDFDELARCMRYEPE